MTPPQPLPTVGPATSVVADWHCDWQEHERWLRTILWARFRNVDETEEALQELALAVGRSIGQLRDKTKFAPWAYRLALSTVLQRRRRVGRGKKLVTSYAAEYQPREEDDAQPDPLQWLLSSEQQRLVRDALAQLPERDAELLLLKYTEDWSYQKIAVHLGMSASAVESRLHRARQRMRQMLAKAHEIDPVRK